MLFSHLCLVSSEIIRPSVFHSIWSEKLNKRQGTFLFSRSKWLATIGLTLFTLIFHFSFSLAFHHSLSSHSLSLCLSLSFLSLCIFCFVSLNLSIILLLLHLSLVFCLSSSIHHSNPLPFSLSLFLLIFSMSGDTLTYPLSLSLFEPLSHCYPLLFSSPFRSVSFLSPSFRSLLISLLLFTLICSSFPLAFPSYPLIPPFLLTFHFSFLLSPFLFLFPFSFLYFFLPFLLLSIFSRLFSLSLYFSCLSSSCHFISFLLFSFSLPPSLSCPKSFFFPSLLFTSTSSSLHPNALFLIYYLSEWLLLENWLFEKEGKSHINKLVSGCISWTINTKRKCGGKIPPKIRWWLKEFSRRVKLKIKEIYCCCQRPLLKKFFWLVVLV